MSKSVATDICRFFLPFFVSRSISKKYVFELSDHEKKVGELPDRVRTKRFQYNSPAVSP